MDIVIFIHIDLACISIPVLSWEETNLASQEKTNGKQAKEKQNTEAHSTSLQLHFLKPITCEWI